MRSGIRSFAEGESGEGEIEITAGLHYRYMYCSFASAPLAPTQFFLVLMMPKVVSRPEFAEDHLRFLPIQPTILDEYVYVQHRA